MLVGSALPLRAGPPATQPAPPTTARAEAWGGQFPVFDALFHGRKPNLIKHGLRPIQPGASEFWRLVGPRAEPDLTQPDEQRTRAFARTAARQRTLLYLDIEHWPTEAGMEGATPQDVAATVGKLVRIADWIHDEQPGVRLGFYGVPPLRDYWRCIKPEASPERQAWRRGNEALSEVARHVDVLYPSLYTFYDDRPGWEKYATGNLAEARRYGKLVYAFLMPYYHESTKAPYSKQPIEGPFWRLQLETCYRHADGIVIWGGYQMLWDQNAEWWQETLKFLERRDAGERAGAKDAPEPALVP
jgi:hypothetical protein